MRNNRKYETRDRRTNQAAGERHSGHSALFVLCLLSLVLWFAGCTAESQVDDGFAAGLPVELTARVEGHVQSRATVDNTWDGGEEVAVLLDGRHYKFIADARGKLTPDPNGEIPRWNSGDEVKTVVAWYPYSDELPEAITVKKDQVNTPYEQNDFLLAPATRISLTGNLGITFRHLLTKVVVNFKAGDGVTDNDFSKVKLVFCNQPLTSGKINPVGTIERKPAMEYPDSLFAKIRTTPETVILTAEALLVPQMINKNKPLIRIYRVTSGYISFSYFPLHDDELSLESGKKYTYNITVEREGFSVVRSKESTQWDTGSTSELTAKVPKRGFKAGDTKIFDYFYSDGTRSDGGYREYTDNTKAWLDIAPEEGKQVIGIVFQTDPKRMTQAEARKGWINGYVVAVTVCGEYPVNQQGWGTKGEIISGMTKLTTFRDSKDYLSGYEDTWRVIESVGKGNPDALKDTKYEAFYQVSQYGKTATTEQYAAPKGTSGWYLPSVGQWWDIAENLFSCKFSTEGNVGDGQEQSYEQRNISTQLEWIPGTRDFNGSHWTSSLNNDTRAWYINIDYRGRKMKVGTDQKTDSKYVRPVLAF